MKPRKQCVSKREPYITKNRTAEGILQWPPPKFLIKIDVKYCFK